MKAVILLANGFEECEALTPADILSVQEQRFFSPL